MHVADSTVLVRHTCYFMSFTGGKEGSKIKQVIETSYRDFAKASIKFIGCIAAQQHLFALLSSLV